MKTFFAVIALKPHLHTFDQSTHGTLHTFLELKRKKLKVIQENRVRQRKFGTAVKRILPLNV